MGQVFTKLALPEKWDKSFDTCVVPQGINPFMKCGSSISSNFGSWPGRRRRGRGGGSSYTTQARAAPNDSDHSAGADLRIYRRATSRRRGLKKLPLFISHFDLNNANVLVGDGDDEVTGIIDWEVPSDLPFGVGLHRIHDMAGYLSQGRFVMRAYFEEAERGF